jgi:hypothetical protein
MIKGFWLPWLDDCMGTLGIRSNTAEGMPDWDGPAFLMMVVRSRRAERLAANGFSESRMRMSPPSWTIQMGPRGL